MPPATDDLLLERRLRAVMVAIRRTSPRQPVDSRVPKATEYWEANYRGEPTKRAIIYLRSAGCHWAIRHRTDRRADYLPGCFDCEHSVAGTTLGQPISADDLIHQFESTFRHLVPFAEHPILCLYNEGNFFRESELPRAARLHMLRRVAETPGIKRLVIESLPETLGLSMLREAREILKRTELEVAIGLESADSDVRRLCVNKPFNLEIFEEAISRIEQVGARSLIYVMVKPCFVSEEHAIRDAIATVRYATRLGVDAVSLEPVNPSKHNMSGVLQSLGLHRNPWYWSVLEVLRASHGDTEVRVGGHQFAPRYESTAFNGANPGHKCNVQFKEGFEEYNSTASLSRLNRIDCLCRQDWLTVLEKSTDLRSHVVECLERLESHLGITGERHLHEEQKPT